MLRERYLEYLRDQGDLLLHLACISSPTMMQARDFRKSAEPLRRHTRTCKPVVHTPWPDVKRELDL